MSVPGFDSIIGHQRPIRLLQAYLCREAVPHALLFTGTAGIGKRTTAKAFAMALNCRAAEKTTACGDAQPAANACGQCRACRQIAADSHPDVLLIQPQGPRIRVDQIRDLLTTLAMKPFSAACRVVIIAEAQTMNPEAGNALLKVLEEPPADTVLILTAQQKSDLLPTIVSRCQQIGFTPLSAGDLATLLADSQGLDAEQAQTIAELAGGSFTKALRLVQTHWIEQRDWLIRATGLDRPGKAKEHPLALALTLAAHLALRKDHIQELLEVLKTWIRDLGVYPYKPHHMINRDRIEWLRQASSALNLRQVPAMWATVEKAQKDIAANANLRLTLDVMALQLTRLAAQ